jgi:LacI family transcriptional regulator
VSAEKYLLKLFKSATPPQALFTLKNSTTITVFEVLQKLGIEIPSKVALLGYDDFQLADVVRPSITVVRQPIEDMGHSAAELLFKRFLSGDGISSTDGSHNRRPAQLTTKLILRDSCGCEPTSKS